MALRSIDLTRWVLVYDRQRIIDKVKAPLLKAIVTLANRFNVVPTKHNTKHPNSHSLIDVWDRFFEMEDNPGREPLFTALRTISLTEHETDPYYRDRIQVFLELWLEKVLRGEWQPRAMGDPPSCWKNDYRGEGYEFIKEKYHGK